MRFQSIIIKKRDGGALSSAEINYFIENLHRIPPEQTTALLMAIYFNGMNTGETVALTLAMARSGDMADLSAINGIKVDKHSTGGVGDKTTLIVAPIVAACGADAYGGGHPAVKVAKMSGRGLGHTGGTADKLASIPGFKTDLPREEFINIVNNVGVSIVGQTGRLAPADKQLYALRDVTGTVESLPLIASSIMSKKLAAGADCILLDVKTGSGAFMKTPADAEKLARVMVDIGNGAGRKTAAIITNMNRPLGYAIGNSLEIIEAMETLRGGGPADLKELSLILSAKLLEMAGEKNGREKAEAALNNGSAFNKFCEMAEAQGGNVLALTDYTLLPGAAYTREIKSRHTGYMQAMDAERWGIAPAMLGAGRKTTDGVIDYGAGIMLRKKPGDYVNAGEVMAVMHTNDERLFNAAEDVAVGGLTFGETKPEEEPLVYKPVK